jgi:hypothetical protein
MSDPRISIASQTERILGYLNFSSGGEDITVLSQLNEICRYLAKPASPGDSAVWKQLHRHLERQRAEIDKPGTALENSLQAARVIELTFEHVLPGWLAHHRDLLFHQTAESVFNPFFIGRTFEVVLKLRELFDQPANLVRAAVRQLNDYIGHRPCAVLETHKLEPYEMEWVRPIPVYIRGAGVVCGQFHDVIESAISLLRATSREILFAAHFDPELLDELAIDPRAFDFDHPVNKRPNYHFGIWDDRHIDGKGHFRRYVIHQVTLDALCQRVTDLAESRCREELVYEAGAVLAGTILMGSGICGWGPGAHDSSVSLASLMPHIAGYRDRFYNELLANTNTQHRQKLESEAILKKQPFGGARQDLNFRLADLRARQMMHAHLAIVFARMGFADAARKRVSDLPVASTRMICQLECLLYTGHHGLKQGDLASACRTLPRIFDLLLRAIECGAMMDPWNIIGFDASYSLFPGPENTLHDHRAEQLIDIVDALFGFSSSVWIAARARGETAIADQVRLEFRELSDWWYQFATHEVSAVESFDAHEVFEASGKVADLLGKWSSTGFRRDDLEFWATHASAFRTDREYVLAISSLIERDDFSTSMALLIHWLGSETAEPGVQSIGSFQNLTSTWIARQLRQLETIADNADWTVQTIEVWNRIRKFCDYAEANAGELWNIPRFTLQPAETDEPVSDSRELDFDPMPDEPTDGEDRFDAAYEGVIFRESADDGVEGSVFEGFDGDESGMQEELDSIVEHLRFIDTIVACRAEATLLACDLQRRGTGETLQPVLDRARATLSTWASQATSYEESLFQLVDSVSDFELITPSGSTTSLAEYDRQRLFKESLLDNVIHSCIEASAAAILMRGAVQGIGRNKETENAEDLEERLWIETTAAVLTGDRQSLVTKMPEFCRFLGKKPLLYVPLARGGSARKIAAIRVRQALLGQLLENLPRLGLFAETRVLLQTALTMERNQSIRQGAVTQFDELFQIAFTSMVEALVAAAEKSGLCGAQPDDDSLNSRLDPETSPQESDFFEALETLAESMLTLWLSHSATLRLSVLEKVRDDTSWNALVKFIREFGEGMLTQNFLNLSNIRAILHQGVDRWLDNLDEEQAVGDESEESGQKLLAAIRAGHPREDIVRHLTMILEAIIENFAEYRDYNSTTTQSDDGRLLHLLLDFLRLRCKYDQLAWNLKPVMWAHETLVRSGFRKIARQWRRILTEKVEAESDRLQAELRSLQQRHSIQMATVTQRLNEKFVHPMQVDRLLSLVRPAVRDPQTRESKRAFALIENYSDALMKLPAGAGFDPPVWLAALENEVELVIAAGMTEFDDKGMIPYDLPHIRQLMDELDRLPKQEPVPGKTPRP